jgi:hypothetical protein
MAWCAINMNTIAGILHSFESNLHYRDSAAFLLVLIKMAALIEQMMIAVGNIINELKINKICD